MTSSYLFVNELRVHYLQWNPDSGRPILLLHGLASNARIWELVAPRLAEQGFSVYAPDARGHGLTDKPDGDYGFDTFRQDLAALVEALHLDHPLLIGHSWGASVALDYAAHRSIGARQPAGIVLVDGGLNLFSAGSGMTWEEVRKRLAPPPLKGMRLQDFLSRIRNSKRAWQPDEQTLPIILANFEIDENDIIAPHLTFERHMEIVRALWDFQTAEVFEKINCPTLMIPAIPAGPHSAMEQEYLENRQQGVALAK